MSLRSSPLSDALGADGGTGVLTGVKGLPQLGVLTHAVAGAPNRHATPPRRSDQDSRFARGPHRGPHRMGEAARCKPPKRSLRFASGLFVHPGRLRRRSARDGCSSGWEVVDLTASWRHRVRLPTSRVAIRCSGERQLPPYESPPRTRRSRLPMVSSSGWGPSWNSPRLGGIA